MIWIQPDPGPVVASLDKTLFDEAVKFNELEVEEIKRSIGPPENLREVWIPPNTLCQSH